MEEDLPVHVIIIVACVCGAIVVILSIVLAILCCRRRKDQKKYQDAKGNVEEPVNPTRTAGHLKPAIRNGGLDNPGLDQIDLDDPTTGGVFATDTSNKPPSVGYGDKRAPNGHTNGYLWNDYSSPDPQGAPPTYDNMYNSQREKKQQNPKSNTYPETFAEENSKEGSHSSGDSGVAALAQHKPKKVIYEVIV